MTDHGKPVDAVYVDFCIAFDSVCHRYLIKNMKAMEIHPEINRWIEKFLKNNNFRVKFGDHHSSQATVKSGVPQCSVLGLAL